MPPLRETRNFSCAQDLAGPGPAGDITACGKKVGVPYVAALLAFLPFFVAIGVAAFTEPFALKACLWVGGFVVMSAIYLLWVPLEPRGLTKGPWD